MRSFFEKALPSQIGLSPRGYKCYWYSLIAMCVIAVLCQVAGARPAVWINEIQSMYVFSGVYYPKVTLLVLISVATAGAYGIGVGHDVSTAIAHQRRQGNPLVNIVASYWQAQFVKTRFSWKEPLLFKQLDPSYRPLTYGRQLVLLFLFSSLFTGLIWASHFINQGLVFTYHLLLVPLFAIVGSALFLLLPIILIARTPAELTMNLRGVERKTCVGTKSEVEVWLWEQVEDCALTHTVIQGQTLRTLQMTLISEERVIVGLSPNLQQVQLQSFFERMGRTLTVERS